MESRGAVALVLSVALPAMPQACETDQDKLNWESWIGKELVVIYLGIITAIILLVLVSLPVCCGVMKEKNLKPMAITIGVFGSLCLLMPLLTSFIFSSMAIDDFCDRCVAFCKASRDCTGHTCYADLTRDARYDSFHPWSDCPSYTGYDICNVMSVTGETSDPSSEQYRRETKLAFAFAFATNADFDAETAEEAVSPFFICLNLLIVPLSIVGMSLSCCICCPCCGPLLAYKNQQEGERSAAQETAALVDQPESS